MFGGLQDVKFSFASKLAEADIREVLKSVEQVTRDLTDIKPFFTCLTYAASGAAANVNCDLGTAVKRGGMGVAACILHYKDVNATDTLPAGEFMSCVQLMCMWSGHARMLMVPHIELIAHAMTSTKHAEETPTRRSRQIPA